MFCPNATLEEITLAAPSDLESLQALSQVKPWWAKAFGRDVMKCLAEEAAALEASNGEKEGGTDASAGAHSKTKARRRRRARRRSARKKSQPS